MLRPFTYHAPETVEEAVGLLRESGPETRVMAGGTALLVAMERGQLTTRTVIALHRLRAPHRITYAPSSGLRLGSLVTLAGLTQAPEVTDHYPVLGQTVRQMATPQIRHQATIGGNLCSGLPHADLAVTLLALQASVILAGPAGNRPVALADFWAPDGRPALRSGEIVTAVLVPPPAGQAAYHKVSIRRAADLPLANVAVAWQQDGTKLVSVQIAAGGCDGRPQRLVAAEEALLGRPVDASTAARAAAVARDTARQPGDHRATADYRRHLVGVLVQRAFSAPGWTR